MVWVWVWCGCGYCIMGSHGHVYGNVEANVLCEYASLHQLKA